MKKVSLLFLALCIVSLPLLASNPTLLPSGIEYTEIAESINTYVAKNDKTNAGLALAVFTGDSVLYTGYHGYANRGDSLLVDTNTVMEWGSATKILVWASVMQLVEEGKLSLSQDIRAYLPEGFFRRLTSDTPLTLYNLMHHTAGWEDSMLELFVRNEKGHCQLRGNPPQN